jgi:hypothetical protein
MVFWTLCSGCSSPIRRTGNDRAWRCIRCQRQARLDRLRALNEQRKSEAALARAALTCLTCGKPLAASRSTRRFCSDACQQAAHRVG